MSFEGTATNPVVEETAVTSAPEVEVSATPEAGEITSPEVDENGEEVSPPAPVDDTEEVEYEGKKIRVIFDAQTKCLKLISDASKPSHLPQQPRSGLG